MMFTTPESSVRPRVYHVLTNRSSIRRAGLGGARRCASAVKSVAFLAAAPVDGEVSVVIGSSLCVNAAGHCHSRLARTFAIGKERLSMNGDDICHRPLLGCPRSR